jgi:DNA-binding transcriptional MerR regulator
MPRDKTDKRAGADGASGPVFLIGEVSKRFDVSPRWLRHLEKFGLLNPHRNGTARVYNQAECERIAAVLKARKLGFALAEIKGLVSRGDGSEPELVISRERCMQQIEFFAKQRFQIDEAITELWRIHNRLLAQSGS